jgi:DNA polymerase III sliding clamp (beta) subunit (PCNA family)
MGSPSFRYFKKIRERGGFPMKFRMLRSALVDAVSQVSKAVSTRTTIPILTGIKVEADEEGIVFTGSNADMTIRVQVPLREEDKEIVGLERMGNTVLPGRIIGELVRKLPDDEVEWEVDERRVATIRSGQAQFQLNAMDPEEYPRLPELMEDRKFSLPADLLQTMIRQTVFAVSTSEASGGQAAVRSDRQPPPVPTGGGSGGPGRPGPVQCDHPRKKPVGSGKDFGRPVRLGRYRRIG